jgi:hypothetical protein
MNDELVPSDEQVEQRAIALAFGLIAVAADPAGAADRLKKLTAATEAHRRAAAAAERATAEATESKQKADEALDRMAEKIAAHQLWVDGTEKNYRLREEAVRQNEIRQEEREKQLVDRESDLARRSLVHQRLVEQTKAALS